MLQSSYSTLATYKTILLICIHSVSYRSAVDVANNVCCDQYWLYVKHFPSSSEFKEALFPLFSHSGFLIVLVFRICLFWGWNIRLLACTFYDLTVIESCMSIGCC